MLNGASENKSDAHFCSPYWRTYSELQDCETIGRLISRLANQRAPHESLLQPSQRTVMILTGTCCPKCATGEDHLESMVFAGIRFSHVNENKTFIHLICH